MSIFSAIKRQKRSCFGGPMRCVATCLIAIFLFQEPLLAAGGTVSYGDLMSSGRLLTVNDNPPKLAKDFPSQFGRLKKTYQGTETPLIIHIQDAHASRQAQKHIARLTDYFSKKYHSDLILIEGASGELAHDVFSKYPHEPSRRLSADYFLQQGKISGAEYLAWTSRSDLILYGIEDGKLYEENRKVFLETLEIQKNRAALLKDLRASLEKTAAQVFPASILKMIRLKSDFEKSGASLLQYAYTLKEISQESLPHSSFPRLERFLKLAENEKNQKLKKSSSQRDAEIGELSDGFFEEIARAEQLLKGKLLETEIQKKSAHILKVFEIFEKMFSLSLTKEDAEFFYEHQADFEKETFGKEVLNLFREYRVYSSFNEKEMHGLRQDLENVQRFYELALQRDEVLVQNSLDRMRQGNQQVALLITGGFHTPGIEKRLKEENISYWVIEPKIGAGGEGAQEKNLYEQNMKLGVSRLGRLLEKAYEDPKKNSFQSDPVFQLQSPRLMPSVIDFSEAAALETSNSKNFFQQNPALDFVYQAQIFMNANHILSTGKVHPEMIKPFESQLSTSEKNWVSPLLKMLHAPSAILKLGEAGTGSYLSGQESTLPYAMALSWKPSSQGLKREISTRFTGDFETTLGNVDLKVSVISEEMIYESMKRNLGRIKTEIPQKRSEVRSLAKAKLNLPKLDFDISAIPVLEQVALNRILKTTRLRNRILGQIKTDEFVSELLVTVTSSQKQQSGYHFYQVRFDTKSFELKVKPTTPVSKLLAETKPILEKTVTPPQDKKLLKGALDLLIPALTAFILGNTWQFWLWGFGIAFAGRLGYSLGMILHEWAHLTAGAFVKRTFKDFSVSNLLGNRSLGDWSWGLFYSAYLPSWAYVVIFSEMEHIPAIRRAGWIGSLTTLTASLGLTAFFVGSGALPLISLMAWSATVGTAFIFMKSISPRAEENSDCGIYDCGYADYVGPRIDKDGKDLLPSYYLEHVNRTTRVLSDRGTQAYGFEVLLSDRKGNAVLVGLKDVNSKRADLPAREKQDIVREMHAAQKNGFLPFEDLIDLAIHGRYGTTTIPKKKETHPHVSEEKLVFHHDWTQGEKKITRKNKNFQVSVKHNGDNDGIKTEEEILKEYPIFAFGKEMGYKEIREELSRMLYEDTTEGDSPVIAAMLALYNTQGQWAASARLAYLMMSGSLKEAFKDLNYPSKVDGVIQGWGKVFEREYLEHQDKIFVKKNGKWIPDKAYLESYFLPTLTQRIQSDPKIRKDKYLGNFSEEDLVAFTQTAVFAFLHHNTYRALQMMLATTLPSSTYGLSVKSTLEPKMKYWVAKGQPGALGFNPTRGSYNAASDPGAVLAGLNIQSRFLDYNDDEGEIVRLDMKNPWKPVLNIFSMAKYRELTSQEIEARWIPLEENPYIKLASPQNENQSKLKKDLADLNQVLVSVNEGFDSKHRAHKKSPSNRLSADRFNQEMIAATQKEGTPDEANLVFIAEGPSYDVLRHKVEDLRTFLPGIHLIQGNDYMTHRDAYYSGEGAPFKIGKKTIVFAVSQSGMTFSMVESVRDAETMLRNKYLKDVFVMTGEWYSILGRAVGQKYFPDSEFSGRIFSNGSGRRSSEAATMAAATDFFFTKLFLDLLSTLVAETEKNPEYQPFKVKISKEKIQELEQQIEPLIQGEVDPATRKRKPSTIAQITGTDAAGSAVKSPIHKKHLERGQEIANHISEQFFVTSMVRVYTFVSTMLHLPIFRVFALIFTFLTLLATDIQSFHQPLQALPMLESTMLFGVWAAAHIGDSFFYTWQDKIFTYTLRFMQGRTLMHRIGPRLLAIGGFHGSLLRDYFRASLLEAPAGLQLAAVDSRETPGDFVHRFKDAVRGTLAYILFDDPNSNDSNNAQTQNAGAWKMAINQLNGVRSLGAGPHIMVSTANPDPQMTKRYPFAPLVVNENNPLSISTEKSSEETDVFKTLKSHWFEEYKLLVAGQVVAAEMSEALSRVKIPFYVRRSDSGIEKLKEMALVPFSKLYSALVLQAHDWMMRNFFRAASSPRIFVPGRGQSGLTVFTTQIVAPRPNKTGEVKRNIASIAKKLMEEGLDDETPWIPEFGVVSYIYAKLYNLKSLEFKQPPILLLPVNGHTQGISNGLIGSHSKVVFVEPAKKKDQTHSSNGNSKDSVKPLKIEFPWGGSVDNEDSSNRSENRSLRRVEELEDRTLLNGEGLSITAKAFDSLDPVDAFLVGKPSIEATDAIFGELEQNKISINGTEKVSLDQNRRVTQIDFNYSQGGVLFEGKLNQFQYEAEGKPISFIFTESFNGVIMRQLEGKFENYDEKNRPDEGIVEDSKTGFKLELKFDYLKSVSQSPVGIVNHAVITRADGTVVEVTIPQNEISFEIEEEEEEIKTSSKVEKVLVKAGAGSFNEANAPIVAIPSVSEAKPFFNDNSLGSGREVEEDEDKNGMVPEDVLNFIKPSEPAEAAKEEPLLPQLPPEESLLVTPAAGSESKVLTESSVPAPAEGIQSHELPLRLPEDSWSQRDTMAASAFGFGMAYHTVVTPSSKGQTAAFWGILAMVFTAGLLGLYVVASPAIAAGLIPLGVGMLYFARQIEKKMMASPGSLDESETEKKSNPKKEKKEEKEEKIKPQSPEVVLSQNRKILTLKLFSSFRIRTNSSEKTIDKVSLDGENGKYKTADGSIRAEVNLSDPEKPQWEFTSTDNEIKPFIVSETGQSFRRLKVPVSSEFLEQLNSSSGSQKNQPLEFFKSAGTFLKSYLKLLILISAVLGAGMFLWEMIARISVTGLEDQARPLILRGIEWARQNTLPLIYWGGIAGGGALAFYAFRDSDKKNQKLSWIALLSRWGFRGIFLSTLFLVGQAALWIAPMPLLAAGLGIIYGGALIGFLLPAALNWITTLMSFPFRWIPNVSSRVSLKKDIAAVMGIGVLMAAGYFGTRFYNASGGVSKTHLEKIRDDFSPLPWLAPTKDNSPIKESEVPLKIDDVSEKTSLSFEFKNLAPLLYDTDPNEIAVPILAHKEGYLELDPRSQISLSDWLNRGKAFKVTGGQPLQKLKRPIQEAKATAGQKLVEYLQSVDKRYEQLGVYQELSMLKTKLFNHAAILDQKIENYNERQEVSVFGEIRVPLKKEEEGWILPGPRPLGTAVSETVLARVHSERRSTLKFSVPMGVWQNYDLMRMKTWVTLKGEKQEARVTRLVMEPRLDGQLILTVGLHSEHKIFDWNLANQGPVSADLQIEIPVREKKLSYSDQFPGISFISSYAETGERVRFSVNPTGAVGRVNLEIPKNGWVEAQSRVGGVEKKDQALLKAIETEAEVLRLGVTEYLGRLQELIDKKKIPFAPSEAKKFAEDFLRIKEAVAALQFMDYQAPQTGMLIPEEVFNKQGQPVQDQPVAEGMTPQMFIRHRIEKRFVMENGEIAIVSNPATGKWAYGIIRQVDRELTNESRGEDQSRFQEILIEMNHLPKNWFEEGDFTVKVHYAPASLDPENQRVLHQGYALYEKELAATFAASNLPSLPALPRTRFVPPATEEDKRLLIHLMEQPSEPTLNEKAVSFSNLPPEVMQEQKGEPDSQFLKSNNREIQRILQESNGGARREWMTLFLQNQNIPIQEIEHLILHGSADISQMGLEYLVRQQRIIDLIAIHRSLYLKSPELDMTKLARAHIVELLETDEDSMKRLVQLHFDDPKRRMAQEFLISLLSVENAVTDVDYGIVTRKILTSNFWRTYADKLTFAYALENTSPEDPFREARQQAAFFVRNMVFAEMAEHVGWALGEPQDHAKTVGPIERYDPNVWDRLHSMEKNDEEDRLRLSRSPWILAAVDPHENFKGRIHPTLYEKAREEYDLLDSEIKKTRPAALTLLEFMPETGTLFSDHVFNHLDILSQRNDYIQHLNLYALERFLEMADRPENESYRKRREQVIDQLIKNSSPEARVLLARIFIKSQDPEVIQKLLDKEIDTVFIEETHRLKVAPEAEQGKFLLFQQALVKLSGLEIVNYSENAKQLALRAALDTLTDFELKELAQGEHSLKKILEEAGVTQKGVVVAAAHEQINRKATLWAIEKAGEWSKLTLRNQVFSPAESVLNDLKEALSIETFQPSRVETIWATGLRDHSRIFERLADLYELRQQQILKGGERESVGHLETYRLSLSFLLAMAGLVAGLILSVSLRNSSEGQSLNKRTSRFFSGWFSGISTSFSTPKTSPRKSEETISEASRPSARSEVRETSRLTSEANPPLKTSKPLLSPSKERKPAGPTPASTPKTKGFQSRPDLAAALKGKTDWQRFLLMKESLSGEIIAENLGVHVPGQEEQRGMLLINYKPGDLNEAETLAMIQKLGQVESLSKLVFYQDVSTNQGQWEKFSARVRVAAGSDVIVKFVSQKEAASLDQYLTILSEKYALNRESMIQVTHPGLSSKEIGEETLLILTGALALSENTVVILGKSEALPGVFQAATQSLIAALLAAQEALATSA